MDIYDTVCNVETMVYLHNTDVYSRQWNRQKFSKLHLTNFANDIVEGFILASHISPVICSNFNIQASLQNKETVGWAAYTKWFKVQSEIKFSTFCPSTANNQSTELLKTFPKNATLYSKVWPPMLTNLYLISLNTYSSAPMRTEQMYKISHLFTRRDSHNLQAISCNATSQVKKAKHIWDFSLVVYWCSYLWILGPIHIPRESFKSSWRINRLRNHYSPCSRTMYYNR